MQRNKQTDDILSFESKVSTFMLTLRLITYFGTNPPSCIAGNLFQMKTTQSDGLIFASWLPTTGHDGGGLGLGYAQRPFVSIELSAGHLRYVYVPAGSASAFPVPSVSGSSSASAPASSAPSSTSQTVTIRGPAGQQPINDNRWHDVALVVTMMRSTSDDGPPASERHALHVDNTSKTETLQPAAAATAVVQSPSKYGHRSDGGTTAAFSMWSPVELYVGGLPPVLMQELPKQVRARCACDEQGSEADKLVI